MPRVTERYVQPGEVLTVTAPYDVQPGDGVLVGNLFGVALGAALSGASVEIATDKVWRIAKTAAQTGAQGALAYWDNTAKSITSVSTNNYRVGCYALAAGGADPTATVRLNGAAVPTGA